MSAQPTNWIKHVESVAAGAQDIPMWGSIPSFPWTEFAKALSASLGTKELKISAGAADWKAGSAILTGMGRSPLQIAVELSPLKGCVSLIFPVEDFSKLSAWMIHPEAGNAGFSDPYLQKGFFRYLSVEAIATLDQLKFFRGLTPKVTEASLAKEDAYCIDIAIEHEGETIWGRLICPRLFQETFKEHFTSNWNFSIPSHLYEELFVDISMVAGTTQLSQKTLKNIHRGDFVLLDHFSYYPNLKKGTFQLCVDKTPLFQAKIKEESIKILDYAHYFEETNMDEESFDDSFDESMEEEEESQVAVQGTPDQEMLSPNKVPVTLSVEVAKIKMSLDKLLKLKPGNVLELGIQPEKGVNLIANGKCIGKGELLQVGDVVGVKIIKLGE